MQKGFYGRISNSWIGQIGESIISSFEFNFIKHYHDKKLMKLMKQIMKEDRPFLLKPSELMIIYSFAKNQTSVSGDYAEVGVYKGATAKAICEAKLNKNLYLFDTFEGLPRKNKIDDTFKERMYKADFQKVKNKLAKYSNVYIYKGLFPETGTPLKSKRFAFVHLDVDIYKSTKDSLNFFYSKMFQGGIIISHDYHTLGVRRAFDEFFKDKSEQVIELPLSQCMIIKR